MLKLKPEWIPFRPFCVIIGLAPKAHNSLQTNSVTHYSLLIANSSLLINYIIPSLSSSCLTLDQLTTGLRTPSKKIRGQPSAESSI